MEAIRSSETSDKTGTTRCYTPEEDILNIQGVPKRNHNAHFATAPTPTPKNMSCHTKSTQQRHFQPEPLTNEKFL
jgi:hypothetical protein